MSETVPEAVRPAWRLHALDGVPPGRQASRAAGLSLLAVLGAVGCQRSVPPAPESQPPRAVKLVQPRDERGVDRVPARIEALRRATLSTRLPARVSRVHVAAGDAVQSGQVLVSLADDDLRAQLVGAQATYSTAQAHERRVGSLIAQGAAPKTDLEAAQAQTARAQASLKAAEESLRYTQLRAPFAGRVQAKRVDEGDLVLPGSPLVDIEGPELELVANLGAEDIGRVATGQTVAFEALPVTGTAVVTGVPPSADPVTHRVEVRARVVKPAPELRAGVFARLLLPAKREQPGELRIPITALIQRGDLKGVFVASKGRAQLRWVLAGDTVDGAVAVRAGLLPGEQVVDQPGDLVDGQPIEVAVAH